MDQTTIRIMQVLSSNLGNPISINELTRRIRESYGTAYYANIYRKLQQLSKQHNVKLSRLGRSSIASLNLQNYLVLDVLASIELQRKQEHLKKRSLSQILLQNLEERLEDFHFIKSASLINPEKNFKLNRAELLILIYDLKETHPLEEAKTILREIQNLQNTHNIKLDSLVLTRSEFLDFLASQEINPVKEMLSNGITFHSPHALWAEVSNAIRNGLSIRFESKETHPSKISEKDLAYNLARFGYREIGPELRAGQDICIEYVIIAIMMQGDARRIQAIPIILAKNKATYSLLIFLAQKYNMADRLLGLLRTLNRIKPRRETELAVGILESMVTKEVKLTRTEEESVEKKMRLYGVIR